MCKGHQGKIGTIPYIKVIVVNPKLAVLRFSLGLTTQYLPINYTTTVSIINCHERYRVPNKRVMMPCHEEQYDPVICASWQEKSGGAERASSVHKYHE